MEIDGYRVENGIETCEDKCKCGGNLRLHTYIFGTKAGKPEPKFYVDCGKCMATASCWKSTPTEAIQQFDKENM